MKSKSWNFLLKRQPNLPIGIATAVLSLLLLAGIVASAMGQPLLTGQELLSAWQVVQWLAAGVLLLIAGALCFWFVVVVVLPIRDNALSHHWQRRQDRATEHQQAAASPSERPIIVQHSGSNLALKAARAKAENLQVLLNSISDGLSSLCYQVTGQQEPDAVRAIKVLETGWRETLETMRELDAQLSESALEVPQERTGGAPRGATWLTYESVLALVKAGNVGIKKAQMIARENGGVVGRDDYQRLQEILAYLPSPIDQGGAYESRKQAVNGKPGVGEPANATRKPPAMGRSQPRIRKGKR